MAEIKCARLASYQEALGRITGLLSCWQNQVPCGCRTEVPVFFLAADHSQLLGPAPRSFPHGLLHPIFLVF